MHYVDSYSHALHDPIAPGERGLEWAIGATVRQEKEPTYYVRSTLTLGKLEIKCGQVFSAKNGMSLLSSN